MHSQSMTISMLAATAALVAAVPNPAAQICPDFYLIEKWGATFTQPRWNSSSFGTFKGCTASNKNKRDGTVDNPDTKVEVTDSHIVTSYFQSDEDPADQLWDRTGELCGDTFCDANKEISVSSGRADDAEGTELYLSLDGEFSTTEIRDNFLSLLKDAFHKSITQTVDEELAFVTASNAAAVGNGISTYGKSLDGFITYRFREGNPDSADCPQTIQTINSFGSLVPELAPFFGFSAGVCSSISG